MSQLPFGDTLNAATPIQLYTVVARDVRFPHIHAAAATAVKSQPAYEVHGLAETARMCIRFFGALNKRTIMVFREDYPGETAVIRYVVIHNQRDKPHVLAVITGPASDTDPKIVLAQLKPLIEE